MKTQLVGGIATPANAVKIIGEEIRVINKPTNPSLPRNFEKALRIISQGGTIIGYYGYGKTLIAVLASLILSFVGRRSLMIDVSKLRELQIKSDSEAINVKVGEITPILVQAMKNLDDDTLSNIIRWFSKYVPEDIKGSRIRTATENVPKKNVVRFREDLQRFLDKQISFKKSFSLVQVINTIKSNLELDFLMLDEFERIRVSYEYFKYESLSAVLEEIFRIADEKASGVSLFLPLTIHNILDIETKSRLEPIYTLNMSVKEGAEFAENFAKFYSKFKFGDKRRFDEFMSFFKEYRISYRVPRLLVSMVAEAIETSYEDLIKSRLAIAYIVSEKLIRRVTDLYARARRILLRTILLVSMWLEQSFVCEISSDLINRAYRILSSYLLEALREYNITTDETQTIIEQVLNELSDMGLQKVRNILIRAHLIESFGDRYYPSTDFILSLKRITSKESPMGERLRTIIYQRIGKDLDEFLLEVGVSEWQ